MKVQGVVEARKDNANGIGIVIDGTWYNSYKGKGLKGVNKGDKIRFEFTKKNGFNNIDADTIQVKKAESSGTSGGNAGQKDNTNRPAFSQLGVELGHAANLAMQMTLHMKSAEHFTVDEWERNTVDLFLRMKDLRQRAEAGFVKETTEDEPSFDDEPEQSEEPDIFDDDTGW